MTFIPPNIVRQSLFSKTKGIQEEIESEIRSFNAINRALKETLGAIKDTLGVIGFLAAGDTKGLLALTQPAPKNSSLEQLLDRPQITKHLPEQSSMQERIWNIGKPWSQLSLFLPLKRWDMMRQSNYLQCLQEIFLELNEKLSDYAGLRIGNERSYQIICALSEEANQTRLLELDRLGYLSMPQGDNGGLRLDYQQTQTKLEQNSSAFLPPTKPEHMDNIPQAVITDRIDTLTIASFYQSFSAKHLN